MDNTASTEVVDAADRLRGALRTGRPTTPVRDLIGTDDIAAAYATQRLVNADRLAAGAKVVGRKIGLTSPAVQRQLGVDRPDFGVLFDDMTLPDGSTLEFARVMQPKVEAEVAFVLAADLVEGPLDAAQVRAAIGHVHPALEICGSRIADWDISFGDTVADNASAGAYVLGTQRLTLEEIEPREVGMRMTVDGTEVSSGDGTACLGDPIEAVVWLARQVRDLGEPLRAGEVILSGALGPMHAVDPGDTVVATLTGLGEVSIGFSPTSPSKDHHA